LKDDEIKKNILNKINSNKKMNIKVDIKIKSNQVLKVKIEKKKIRNKIYSNKKIDCQI